MIRFRSNTGYQHQTDDGSASSSDSRNSKGAVLSASPPTPNSSPPSSPPQPTPNQRYQQPNKQQEPQLQVVTESSNADTIMDLAATIPSSKVLYQMEEKKINSVAEDEEVERIVSAVTKGLRKKKSSSRSKATSKNTVNATKTPTRSLKTALQSKFSQKSVVLKEEPTVQTSSGDLGRPPKNTTVGSSPMGVEVVPVISDDETMENDKTPKRSHRRRQKKKEPVPSGRKMIDESVASSAFTDDVDYDYNYIDDESYGDTSSSSSSYSSSSESSIDADDDSDSEDSVESTASLTDQVESSFDAAQNEDKPFDHDDKSDTYRPDRSAPRGLDIVAHLLSGATEVTLDAHSITNSGSKTASTQTVARHVAEALAQTHSLQKVSFCGPWKGQSNKTRIVLEILFDGLLSNSSIHTLVLKDNHCLDRYAGYAFGTFLKAHDSNGGSRLQKLEIAHCNFVGSGWNSLFLGLQHSTSIKRLSVVDCANLSSDDFDCITSTIQYLSLEQLKLCNINIHKSNIENLSFLFRAIQQTKTLKDVDLSRNNLGGAPRAILLLSRCLAGDPVWIESSSKESEYLPFNYHHHIEKLTLVDCGISDKASVRTLAKAMDSSLAKLDANNNEHPLVLNSVDLGKNKFGNSGAKLLLKLLENNASITTMGMVGCGVSAKNLKIITDRLRYNNSFLQKLGLSSGVSLAILDSMSAVENVFNGRKSPIERTESIAMAEEEDDSDIEASSRMSACGGC